jgi:hypothetical protein
VCKQWYLPAQRIFLEHIVLASCYEVEKFVEYFLQYGTPTLFSSVRTFRIGSTYTPPDRARHLLETHAIEAIIDHFPNILEFIISGNCINLTYFQKEGIVDAMQKNWPHLQIFRVDAGWLPPDERRIYLETNYCLRRSIRQLIHYEHSYVTEDVGGLKAYLSSFPNLKQIKVVSREVCNLLSALPIIEYSQGLTSLDLYVTREDVGCLMENYSGNKSILKEKVTLLRHLKISMAIFCTYTVEFIIHHLTALRQAHISINQVNIKEWTDEQKELFKDGVLDFLCLKDTFSVRSLQINYNQQVEYMHKLLGKLYHNVPSSGYTRIERHVHLGLYNNSPDVSTDYNSMYSNVRNFGFEMKSRIENDVLIRSAHFDHFILLEGGLRNKSLKYLRHMDSILEDITSLTFNTYGMNVLTHLLPNIFEDTIQQFINLKKVSVHLSRNDPKPSSFLSRETTSVHPQLTHLEIISGGNALLILKDMLPIASRSFPSLKYVSLWFHSGYYENKEFIVHMEESRLERLHLDVTPIRDQGQKALEKPVNFFILKVTSTKTSYYRVSLDYLSVIHLEDIKEEKKEDYITMHIVLKSIDYINLYLYRKYTDRPVLTMDVKDYIQTTLSP